MLSQPVMLVPLQTHIHEVTRECMTQHTKSATSAMISNLSSLMCSTGD
jgi:hypothetical protein